MRKAKVSTFLVVMYFSLKLPYPIFNLIRVQTAALKVCLSVRRCNIEKNTMITSYWYKIFKKELYKSLLKPRILK